MTDADVTSEVQLAMYRVMATVKACDARLRAGLSAREFAITYWPAGGQEAIAGALSAALRPDDQLVSTYRGLHDQLAKGASLDGVVINKGKGGAMHVADPSCGLVLSTGIVGAGIPVAVGVALAAQLQGNDRVTVASFGDGATGTGAFHEAVNLAAVWQLPVVFVCQNNGYAEMTPTSHAQPVPDVAARAAAYAIPGVTVDGNDPVATYLALADAVERARAGAGPSLVECRTYRLFGHFFGDPMPYMPEDELEAARKAHPVDRYRARLLGSSVASEETLATIDGGAADAVERAFAAALAAPEPDPAEAFVDVYADATGMPR